MNEIKSIIYLNWILLKGQSNEIFDLQYFSSFEPAWASAQLARPQVLIKPESFVLALAWAECPGLGRYCQEAGGQRFSGGPGKTLIYIQQIVSQDYYLNFSAIRYTNIARTVPQVMRYNTKCRREKEILRRIFRLVSRFLLHFVLYLGNLDYVLDSEAFFVSLW